MGALGLREPAFHGFRLLVIDAAIGLFERVDDRQHEGRPEAPGEKGKRPCAETGFQARHAGADFRQVLAPVLRMAFLDGRETSIDLGELRILFDICQRAIKARAIDLALQVHLVAFALALGHVALPSGTPS